ncbi:MAG: DUF839 domain-containing protein [Candidatus Latescibacteria bacterium]|nr:DUF839 domain-containing protein [Candidatus Latescibacterota bacterium]
MSPTRRQFLHSSAAVALGFSGLHRWLGCAADSPPPAEVSFGPLLTDAKQLLDLPSGFSYKVLSRAGDALAQDLLVPGAQDGMAAFPGPAGKTLLVCNHELSPGAADRGSFGQANEWLNRLPAEAFYDYGQGVNPCLGGTTTLVYDNRTQQLESQHLSLVGTIRNCAGGPTPWNSWISCEESVQRAEDALQQDHGYNFEVPASATPQPLSPRPLKAMGRFNHEAVAVDPASGIVYQTEDRGDGLIFRYVPQRPGDLAAGGRLQALVVRDSPSLDTRNWDSSAVAPGTPLATTWIDIDNVEAPEDDLRFQGFSQGAARFARGEGMWHGNDAIYFACTSGGPARKGQIWRYRPSPHEGQAGEQQQPGILELFIEPNDAQRIDNADNLTVAPWGDIILCEDGPEEQFLVGVTPSGTIYPFARNAMNHSELAGAAFAPDGSTLFVNIQNPGITLAITGPWLEGRA